MNRAGRRFRGVVRLSIHEETPAGFASGGRRTSSSAGTAVGAFDLSSATSKDAATLITLQPGVYSPKASGVGGTTGVALIEVYEVP